MAALAANGNFIVQDTHNIRTQTMLVLAAAVLFNTALCSHDTTSGRIKPFDGTQTDRLVGWHFGDSVTGGLVTGVGAAGQDAVGRICSGGFTVRDLVVATLADDDTDFGKPVFALDDGTYSITDPTSGIIVGHVVASGRNRITGSADVEFVDVAQL